MSKLNTEIKQISKWADNRIEGGMCVNINEPKIDNILIIDGETYTKMKKLDTKYQLCDYQIIKDTPESHNYLMYKGGIIFGEIDITDRLFNFKKIDLILSVGYFVYKKMSLFERLNHKIELILIEILIECVNGEWDLV